MSGAEYYLLLCSQNRLRSPAAEQVSAHYPGRADILCLAIPDHHQFMDHARARLVQARMRRRLRQGA